MRALHIVLDSARNRNLPLLPVSPNPDERADVSHGRIGVTRAGRPVLPADVVRAAEAAGARVTVSVTTVR